jgi:hypothetical protein
MKNALIHAQDHVDNMLIVEWSITTQFVLVYQGTLVMRLHIANCYLPVRTKTTTMYTNEKYF